MHDLMDVSTPQDEPQAVPYPSLQLTLPQRSPAHWRGHPVAFHGGTWRELSPIIPSFTLMPFVVPQGGEANPDLKMVVREPLDGIEKQIPVGIVSNTYALIQHAEAIRCCFTGMKNAGADVSETRVEIGLTPLGERLNARLFFPPNYSFTPRDGNKLDLCVEIFNSVDGSSRLIILLSWRRLICSNGLVIKRSLAEIRSIHDRRINLPRVGHAISAGTLRAEQDRARLKAWQEEEITHDAMRRWVDGPVTRRWGKKAAVRVFHICLSGRDVRLAEPFQVGAASEKKVHAIGRVPGAPEPAATLYDACQALSWVATKRSDVDERLGWQTQIPALIHALVTCKQN